MKLLEFQGVYKDYLWGGNKLKEKYNKNSLFDKTAESWELSVHPDGKSIISDGVYNGKSLADYIKQNPDSLGTNRKSDELPILIKLIDSGDKLSVQVHPDDEMAKKLEKQNGKTEVWYVMDADEDANIIFGVKEDVSKEELKNAIESDTIEELLNTVTSKKGDVFFVDAGTIHGIGKGNLIVEIQQNSNVTYRFYDYNRRDKFGNQRELHIEKGLMAANTKRQTERNIPICSDGTRLVASCEYFSVKEVKVGYKTDLECRKESYQALVCVDGIVEFINSRESRILSAGQTIFLPAGLGKYSLKGNGTVLITENPPRYFVGIDLGGTNIACAVVDEFGNIHGRSWRKTSAPRPYNEIFDDMALCAKEAALNSGIKWDNIESVGIGCPGAINKETGYVDFSNNLDFYDVPIPI